MKINESVIDNIIHNIIKVDLIDYEITGTEISTLILLDEKEGIFEVPIKIKLKKKVINNYGDKPKKVPFAFQNAVRKKYFEIFGIFVSDYELILDIDNYKDDVIIDRKNRNFNPTGIVAIIDSHSAWGEADDLTNERINRKYNGLKISVVDNNYRHYIEKIADSMKRNLEEDVIIK